MKNFNGKAIYSPQGKAGEYAEYACNFYVGCSNGCEYCYCKKGILAGVMGQDKPQLKKCFKDESHALEIFEKELNANLSELQKHGIFFSFTTDPCLPETILLTNYAVELATDNDVPCKILTKCTEWVDEFLSEAFNLECEDGSQDWRIMYAFGFTLTGHDELEPGASTNQERIEAMKKLHDAGFKTFASIEPIIDFESSYRMIMKTIGFCDLYKVGLMSGKKYDISDCQAFIEKLNDIWEQPKIYLKESIRKLSKYSLDELDSNFINADYNIFE